MTWKVTGRIRPLDDGSYEVDLTAEKSGVGRKSSSATISASSDEDFEAQIALAKDGLGPSLAELATEMVDLLAKQNKRGKVAVSRALREVYLPLTRAMDTLPDEALVVGMEKALAAKDGRGSANINWVKKAAASYLEDRGSAMPQQSNTQQRYDILGGNRNEQ